MLEDTISKIEARIETSTDWDQSQRVELLKLLDQLKAEIDSLPATHQKQAQTIAVRTEESIRHIAQPDITPKPVKQSTRRLEDSVRELEASHPQLVAIVARISNLLSNMGI